MSLTNTACRAQYTGNGTTVSFATGFYFLENSDVSVIVTVSGVNTTLNQGTDYTISGALNPSGGTVLCAVAPVSGATITVVRTSPLTQHTTFVDNDSLPAISLEEGLDKLTMIAQEMESSGGSLARAIQFPVTEPSTTNTQLPVATTRANALFGFDVNGNIYMAQGMGNPRGLYVPGTAYNAHDIFNDASENIYQATQNYTAVSIVADLAAGDIVLIFNAVAIAAGISGSVTPIAPWATNVAYAVGNIVYYTTNLIYRCAVAHTSGVFATDLGAGKWVNLAPSNMSAATFAVDSGTTNAYVVNPSPAPAALVAGLMAQFTTTHTNNGASTLNFSGFGVKSIKKNGATALIAGDIVSGVVNVLQYDGTNWQLQNPPEMQPANNLSDVASVATARSNLGLGTAAVLNVGMAAGNVVQLNGSAQLPAVDGSLLTNLPNTQNLITVVALTTSGTWIVPTGVTQIKVTVIGGGGGGGGAAGGNDGQCGGGGGGAMAFLTGLTPGSNITYTVGAGGTSVNGTTGTGGTGGTSAFNGTITATGGTGGTPSLPGGPGIGSGGAVNAMGGYATILGNGVSGYGASAAFGFGVGGFRNGTAGNGTAGAFGGGGGGTVGTGNNSGVGGAGIIIIEY